MTKDRSKKMCGHGVSVNQRSEVCLSHIVCDFLFNGYPCSKSSKNENMALHPGTPGALAGQLCTDA